MPRPKGFNQDEVLNSAMQLFWEKGYEATSIQDLVAHLGINKQSLYDTFGDKQTLYLMALNRYRLERELWLNSLNAGKGSVKKAFKTFFETLINNPCEETRKKGCFLNNAANELASQNEEINKICLDGMQAIEKRFSNLIKQGQASGELSQTLDADGIAAFFYIVLNGLNATGKIKADKKKLKEIMKNTLSVLE